jgi:NAD(P)-dependent dehydrogenase (short-subunit alcohol dehydrogenase family)
MLKEQVVVVTGASAGIGRATARAFARTGARVGLLARGRDGLEAARCEIEAEGGRALVATADVADFGQVDAAAEAFEHELGPIDVWVNNAMATIFSPFIDIAPEEYKRATDVTYLGTVHGTLAALKRMRPRDRGTIVQVGSALAYRAIPLQSAYCGAKFAVRGFTDSLRSELLHDGSRVRLTMVQLAAFNTPQFDWARSHMDKRAQPIPPIFQPEVAAAAIVRAARRPRREMCVGFPALRAILAQKIAPGLLDCLLAGTGYRGQRSDEPEPANRPDNLYAPIAGDHGVHGRFGARARNRSWQAWLSGRRPSAAATAVALLAAALLGAALRRAGGPHRLGRGDSRVLPLIDERGQP